MYKTYYYPISSTSLASIFGSACIFPAALYKNRNQDIQNRLSEVVLLTSCFGCKECDCCLEVILTQDEIKNILVDLGNSFFIYTKPIPISRIKKIYFRNGKQVDRTITGIRMSTAFIPDSIIDRDDNMFDNASAYIAEMPNNVVTDVDALSTKQMEFDRVLGSLALMRVAHVSECNVSPRYIDTLSFFNTEIKIAKSKVGYKENKYYKVFKDPNNILKNVINEQIIVKQAEKQNQRVVKNQITKIIDTDNLDDWAYTYTILYTYGVENESKKKRVDELILNNFQKIKEGQEEDVAFSYGYNRGYSILGNVYQNDRNSVDVKYKLESLLDYYTIESVFNYVIFDKISSYYEYFDWVKPLHHRNAKKGEYLVMDTLIHDKKKIVLFSKEWWNESLPIYLKKDNFTILGLDLSSVFMDKFIKPWTDFVRKEIQEQFDEEKERLVEQYNKDVFSLKESLSELRKQNDFLKKANFEMAGISNTFHNEKKNIELSTNAKQENNNNRLEIECLDDVVANDAKGYSTLVQESSHSLLINEDNVSIEIVKDDYVKSDSLASLSSVDMREYAIKILDYAFMKKTDLKKLAKEKGLRVPKNMKVKDIILLLLEANTGH